jgi:mRNA-degrading endonuclease RelE of RelBE toxin-antitoxin system
MWRLEWTLRAIGDAEKLDSQVRKRLIAALDRLAETGQGDLRRLREERGLWRVRVGDWRIIARAEGRVLRLLRILHRREAYRR